MFHDPIPSPSPTASYEDLRIVTSMASHSLASFDDHTKEVLDEYYEFEEEAQTHTNELYRDRVGT